MKKRFFAMTFCLLPFTLMAAPIVDIDFSSGGPYTSGLLGGQSTWTTPSDATSASVIASGGASPVGSDQVVRLPGNSSSTVTIRNENIFTDSPLTGSLTIDIWMKRSSANSSRDSYVNITSQSSLGNGVFVGFDDDRFFYEKIGNNNSLTDQTYTADTWYRFHLELEPSVSHYSLTIYDIAGEVVVNTLTGLEFRGGTAVSALDVLRMTQNGGSGTSDLYIGAIVVNTIPEPVAGLLTIPGVVIVGSALRRRKGVERMSLF